MVDDWLALPIPEVKLHTLAAHEEGSDVGLDGGQRPVKPLRCQTVGGFAMCVGKPFHHAHLDVALAKELIAGQIGVVA